MPELRHSFTPRKGLRDYVEAFEILEGGSRTSTTFGLPCVDTDIVLNFGTPLKEVLPGGTRKVHPRFAVYGAGPTAARYEWSPDSALLIARLRPGAAALFLKNPCARFVNEVVPLEEDWGETALRMEERLAGIRSPLRRVMVFEDFMAERMAASQPPPAPMLEALRLIGETRGMAPVGGLAESLGVSHRMLNRHFDRWVGMSLKLASRVLRFERMAKSLEGSRAADWAGVACDFGFVDQSHLIRDFREFIRMTPAEYLASAA